MWKRFCLMLYKLFCLGFLVAGAGAMFDTWVLRENDIGSFLLGLVIVYVFYRILASRRVVSAFLHDVEAGDARIKRTGSMRFTGFGGRTSGADDWRARKEEADRRVWERTKARDAQIFHENQARKQAGTYAGYQAENRARAARDRANRY